MDISVAVKFTENENVDIKVKTELSSDIVIDEVHVKQEVIETPEEVAQGSPNYTHNCTNYKLAGISQGAHCNSCWTYCTDTEGLKDHLEISPECSQYQNSILSVVEDRPGDNSHEESFNIYELPTPCETADVEHCTDAIAGGSRNDPTCNMKCFVEPTKITTNIKSSSAGAHDICKNSVTLNCDINTHKSKHAPERQFTCDKCNQSFTLKRNLNRHKLKHTGERQFTCDVCNQKFTQKSHLNIHKLKHTGDRPFTCEVCNQTFIQKCDLHRHKLIHTGDRPFSCDICNQAFTQKGNLNVHKLIHTEERSFSCHVCKQTFNQKCDLNTHKLKHTRERPFACNVCNQNFTQKGTLNTHMLKHTGERPFSCDVCNRTFILKYQLNKHKLKHSVE